MFAEEERSKSKSNQDDIIWSLQALQIVHLVNRCDWKCKGLPVSTSDAVDEKTLHDWRKTKSKEFYEEAVNRA